MGCGGSKPNAVANPVAAGGGGGSVVHSPGETCEQLWKFGKQLGSGAYSTVYLAKHKVSGGDMCSGSQNICIMARYSPREYRCPRGRVAAVRRKYLYNSSGRIDVGLRVSVLLRASPSAVPPSHAFAPLFIHPRAAATAPCGAVAAAAAIASISHRLPRSLRFSPPPSPPLPPPSPSPPFAAPLFIKPRKRAKKWL
jgi:hypothetical protein